MRISEASRTGWFRAGALASLVALALTGSVLTAPGEEVEPWIAAAPGFAWEFPRDHWSHPGYRTEWWYFTGHLRDAAGSGGEFGYQFTLFRIGLMPEPDGSDSAWSATDLVMGHASVTDKSDGRHRFSEVLVRSVPFLGGFAPPGEHPIGWVRSPTGSAGRWSVDWTGDRFEFRMNDDPQQVAFRLTARPLKPRVFQGPGGYSRKSVDGSASLYYSQTRMETRGELTLGDRSWQVEGTSWMDKEFSSNHLGRGQVGWDWFSLQLDDGRELMLYRLRQADESSDYTHGTWVDVDGRTRYLAPDAWELQVTDRWSSPRSGIRYPSGWRIVMAGEGPTLVVEPVVEDQENRSRAGGLDYWEGAVEVRSPDGRKLGVGYVELTGYGEGNRPPV